MVISGDGSVLDNEVARGCGPALLLGRGRVSVNEHQ